MRQFFKRFIGWGVIIVLLILLISQAKILMFNDISVEPISAEDNMDFNGIGPKRPPVYLVSYAGGPEIFYKNQNTLVLSALNKGIDFILNYRKSLLDPAFVKKNNHILSQKRGDGYWLWKPYIILKTLENSPENSIIIYADSGLVFCGSLKKLVGLSMHHEIIVINHTGFRANQLIKQEALQYLQCNTPECRKAPHIWAGFLVLRNTTKSRAFIRKWLQYAENERLLTDIPSNIGNDTDFVQHQHDEGILGILCFKEKDTVTVLPLSAFKPFFEFHHRHPGKEFYTLLPRMHKHITGIERKFLNSALMIKLREFFLTRYFTNHFEPTPPRKD